ncbi:MAG: hypothetical protein PUA56_00615 [Bacillales bacterium]|nr:hypothetical protein [Bacillales bacterium]
MKLNKILTLSASVLMALTLAGCGGNNNSNEGNNNNDVLVAAAEYLFQMYREDNGSVLNGDKDLVTLVVIEGKKINVTWELNVTSGVQDVIKIEKKDDKHVSIVTGYWDGKITEETSFTVTPTMTYEDTSKSITELLEDNKGVLSFTTSALTLGTHDDWVNLANDKTTPITLKGTVVAINNPEGSSSSKGSIYLQDKDGFGYYVYNAVPNDGKTYAKAGDTIIVSGTRSDYSGQEEFAKEAKYVILDTTSADVVYLDATEAFASATSNASSVLGATYQNRPIELKGCTPVSVDGSYYYFTVGSGTTKFNIYKNNYFLTTEENNAWTKLFEQALSEGRTFDLKGIATVYSNAYQIYFNSDSKNANITLGQGLSLEQKKESVKLAFESAIKDSYDKDGEITFNLPTYVTSYTLSSTGTTIVPSEDKQKFVVTLTNSEVTNDLTIVAKIGDEEATFTKTAVTEDNTYDKYEGTLLWSDLQATTEEKTNTIKASKGANLVDVNVRYNNIGDKSSYNEMDLLAKSDTCEGGYIHLSVEEGTILKVIVHLYRFDNVDIYAGSDNTSAALSETKETSSNDLYVTATPNSKEVYIHNASSHNNSVMDVKVVVGKLASEDTPVLKQGINLNSIPAFANLDKGAVYFDGVTVEFTYEGAKWTTNPEKVFGRPAEAYNPTLNSLGVMQFKKESTIMQNVEPMAGYKTVTINWYATYSSEATNYFPIVAAGTSADSLVDVTADQKEALNGVDTGLKDGNYSVYKYQNTYTLPADATYFAIKSGSGLVFADEIIFAK